MSYPNVPLGQSDWQRRVAQATNYLLNEQNFIKIEVQGVPSAGQELLDEQFPFALVIVPASSGLKADIATTAAASLPVTIGGVSAGSITIPATGTEGTFNLSTTEVPAWTRIRILAPSPADATLADFTLALAVIT